MEEEKKNNGNLNDMIIETLTDYISFLSDKYSIKYPNYTYQNILILTDEYVRKVNDILTTDKIFYHNPNRFR